MPFKLIIAGGRNYSRYDAVQKWADFYLEKCGLTEVIIVSGGAKGADALGERYAKERGFPIERHPADWNLGKKAGPIRNKAMSEVADGLLLFDAGGSGSASMLGFAQAKGLRILRINCVH